MSGGRGKGDVERDEVRSRQDRTYELLPTSLIGMRGWDGEGEGQIRFPRKLNELGNDL